MRNKIVELDALAGIGGIQCHGSFDCLHIGHLRYFAWARSLLSVWGGVTVTLTADAYFPAYKGPKRPAFPEDIRAEWISYIGIVDYVAIVREGTGVTAIEIIKPAIYAKGWEANGLIPLEVAAVEACGGRVEYMPKETDGGRQIYSSGRILSGEYLRSRGTRPRGVGEGDYGVE